MEKRIVTVVMIAALVSMSSGCAPFRNFFFGRGAQCGGFCDRVKAPFQRILPRSVAPPPAGCQQPTYVQPQHAPAPCAPAPCAPAPRAPAPRAPANPCATGTPYGPSTAATGCNDPYIGNGVYGAPVVEGQPIYGGDWQQRYNANYPGYKVDRDGAQIIHEEPLPPGAAIVE
jgi:hypothetical protein